MRKVLWNRSMGLDITFECCSSAVATQGCASCSNAARAAPRNSADSRLIFQLIDWGPNMPASGLEVARSIAPMRASLSPFDTNEPGWIENSTFYLDVRCQSADAFRMA